MADATKLPLSSELFIGRWSTVGSPVPKLAAPINDTETIATVTAPLLDNTETVVTGGFLMGIKKATGFTETVWVQPGSVSADGLTLGTVLLPLVRGIDPEGLDYTAGDSNFADSHNADELVFSVIPAQVPELLRSAIQGLLATGAIEFTMGTEGGAGSETITLNRSTTPGAKLGWLRWEDPNGKVEFSNDGVVWTAIDDTVSSVLLKISAADTTPGYGEDKLQAGTGVTITKMNTGANEYLEFSAALPDTVDAHEVYTPAYMEGGTNAETTIAIWDSVSDGEFTITIDGVTQNVTGCDFLAGPVTSMAEVATVIQTQIRAATSALETVAWTTLTKPLVFAGVYQWTASGSGTDEYYLELDGGGDPGIGEPTVVNEDGSPMTPGALGSLAAGEEGYGDNDALGYSTVYVRLTSGNDPDDEIYGFVDMEYSGFLITSADTTSTSEVTVASTYAGAGTDISGAGAGQYMDSDTGNGTEFQPAINEVADAGKIAVLAASGNFDPVFRGDAQVIPAGETIDGTSTPVWCYISDGSNGKIPGSLYKADADDLTNMAVRVTGLVTTSVVAGESTIFQTAGKVGGFTGLTKGVDYFLSETPGAMANLEETNPAIKVGRALSGTEILVDTGKPVISIWSQFNSGTVLQNDWIDVKFTTGFRPVSAHGHSYGAAGTGDASASMGKWVNGEEFTIYYIGPSSTGQPSQSAYLFVVDDYSFSDFFNATVQTFDNDSITLRFTATGGSVSNKQVTVAQVIYG